MRPSWSHLMLAGMLTATLVGLLVALRSGPADATRTGRIAGHSMAPHLLGPHRLIHCPACQFQFPIAATDRPNQRAGAPTLPSSLHCANCRTVLELAADTSTPADRSAGADGTEGAPGSEPLRAATSNVLPGDPVVLVPHTDDPPNISRWELVVINGPAPEPGWVVKRVLGLPGEHLTLRQGDVWVDGRRAARTWDQFRQTLVLVHDDVYRRPDAPPWQPTAHPSGWQTLPRGYAWQSPPTETSPTAPATGGTIAPDDLAWTLGPITDDLPYNVEFRGRLFEVLDGALTGRVRVGEGPASWEVRWVSSNEDWRVRMDGSAGQWSIRCNNRPVAQQPLTDWQEGRFAWYVADGRQAWYWNDRLVWEGTVSDGQTARSPWHLTGLSGSFEVDELMVWRDLYFSSLEPWNSEQTYVLGPDRLFLVGDNVGLSWDSRYPSFLAGPKQVIARPAPTPPSAGNVSP